MSISAKQLAANRANSRKSTGPRTPRGKTASSQNALRHGFYARRSYLPSEDREEFASFTCALFEDLEPVGPVQTLLADRIISTAWRIGRAIDMERTFPYSQSLRTDAEGKEQLDHSLTALMIEDERSGDIFDKISRHESRLNAQFNRDLSRFQALQARRLPQPSREPQVESASKESEKRGLAEAKRCVRRSPKGVGVCPSLVFPRPQSNDLQSPAAKNGFVSQIQLPGTNAEKNGFVSSPSANSSRPNGGGHHDSPGRPRVPLRTRV